MPPGGVTPILPLFRGWTAANALPPIDPPCLMEVLIDDTFGGGGESFRALGAEIYSILAERLKNSRLLLPGSGQSRPVHWQRYGRCR